MSLIDKNKTSLANVNHSLDDFRLADESTSIENPRNRESLAWLDQQRAFETLAASRDEFRDGFLRALFFWGEPGQNQRERIESTLELSGLKNAKAHAVVDLSTLMKRLARLNWGDLSLETMISLMQQSGLRVLLKDDFERPPAELTQTQDINAWRSGLEEAEKYYRAQGFTLLSRSHIQSVIAQVGNEIHEDKATLRAFLAKLGIDLNRLIDSSDPLIFSSNALGQISASMGPWLDFYLRVPDLENSLEQASDPEAKHRIEQARDAALVRGASGIIQQSLWLMLLPTAWSGMSKPIHRISDEIVFGLETFSVDASVGGKSFPVYERMLIETGKVRALRIDSVPTRPASTASLPPRVPPSVATPSGPVSLPRDGVFVKSRGAVGAVGGEKIGGGLSRGQVDRTTWQMLSGEKSEAAQSITSPRPHQMNVELGSRYSHRPAQTLKGTPDQEPQVFPGIPLQPISEPRPHPETEVVVLPGWDRSVEPIGDPIQEQSGIGDRAITETYEMNEEGKAKQIKKKIVSNKGEPLELKGAFYFVDPMQWTEPEIDAVVRAIVEQDTEFYPNASPEPMSVGSKYFSYRWYRVNGEDFMLSTLAGRVRRARGGKAGNRKEIPDSQIIDDWKRRIWKLADQTKTNLKLKYEFTFADPKKWTEAEIDLVVQSIVEQDSELYPNASPEPMSVSQKHFKNRWYRVNGEDLNLVTLANRVRRARNGMHANGNRIPDSQIIQDWKLRIWNFTDQSRADLVLAGEFTFADPSNWTESEIDSVVRAIVEQDPELYPKASPEPMLASQKYFQNRRYRVNGEDLNLVTLANRVRRARNGMHANGKKIPGSQIIQEWKRRIWNFTDQSRADLVLTGEFTFADPRNWTESEIDSVVRAIVEQDSEFYQDSSPEPMSAGLKYFKNRWYRVNGEELTLETLAGRVRRSRGRMAADKKELPDPQIIQDWKERIWNLSDQSRADLVLTGEFTFADPRNWTESEIDSVVRAIVEQDSELYPNASPKPMSTDRKYFQKRWYRVNGKDLTIAVLASQLRRFYGLKANDTKAISESKIVQDWKARIWDIKEFFRYSSNEINDFISRHGLNELFSIFSQRLEFLPEIINSLYPEASTGNDTNAFIRRYVGLNIAHKPQGDRLNLIEGYNRLLKQKVSEGRLSDGDGAAFQAQVNLLIRLGRSDFSENPQNLLTRLQRLKENAEHELLRRIYAKTSEYFQELVNFQPQGMRHPGFSYQREGVYFLMRHERAILADEAGMGKSFQTIGAVQSLGLKRVLWITTASNKESLREEILSHAQSSDADIAILISGDPAARSRQIAELKGQRFRITNYETLRELKEKDPEAYRRLTANLDAVIVDEAQLVDNPDALRTQAVQEIQSPRRWLLTATPYQNRPERLFTLLHWLEPMQFSDSQDFNEKFLHDSDGLKLLHRALSKFMLRRGRDEVLKYFESPDTKPFAEQLSDGQPRLPRKERIAPEQSGGYELSHEQADTIARMTGDFEAWAREYNQSHPDEAIDLDKINALLKFQYIHRAIYQPDLLGIPGENPLWAALDATLERRIAQGEKLILWGWNTRILEALEHRYGKHGVRRIDGSVLGEARDQARHDFQKDPKVKILVANYLSGGVGLTLTAADAEVFTQLPLSFPQLYQAEGRNQRLIGSRNRQYAKVKVESEWLVPRFPAGFVESLEDPHLREILSHGTLVEQTRERLEGGEQLYRLVMSGIGNASDLSKEFLRSILKGMGLG